LPTKLGIDAKVISIEGDTATIAVLSKLEIGAPEVKFEVPLADLENKRYEIDREAEAERLQRRLAKAEKLQPDEWNGFVIEDGGDQAFWTVDEYLDFCDADDREPDDFLWCCNDKDLQPLSADTFSENIWEQCGEDHPEIKGLEELQQAIDRFYAANSNIRLIDADYSKYVVVKQEASQP
jgi:hypothetical protein